ncbi:MAG: hypothetical protein AAGH38_11495, partial [Pseudomonadota bacterium]
MKFASCVFAMCLATMPAYAAVVSSIESVGTAQQVDVTTGDFVGWGYATGGFVSTPFFDNTQDGGAVPTVNIAPNNAFSTGSARSYGHTFTFDDGTNPTAGIG